MKGVILAGGYGTRLYPSTAATNKHLLAIHAFPMIEHPLYTLRMTLQNDYSHGDSELCVVTGAEHREKFREYFDKVHPGINVVFKEQEGAGGIAEALSLTRDFVGDEDVAVILGDNLIDQEFPSTVRRFKEQHSINAMLFLKEVAKSDMCYIDDKGTKRVKHGIAELSNDEKRITGIEEKPIEPKTNLAVIGFYFYRGGSLYEVIDSIAPSERGELEITAVNKTYVERGEVAFERVKGFWSDMGSIENRVRCANFVRNSGRHIKIFNSFPEQDKANFPPDVAKFFNSQ